MDPLDRLYDDDRFATAYIAFLLKSEIATYAEAKEMFFLRQSTKGTT